jgi:uncharacterized protein (TIGR03435 family)
MTQGPFFTGGRYELRQASMLDLIRMAYGVDPERVYGGPSWLGMDRFDVFGKMSGASNTQSRALLRAAASTVIRPRRELNRIVFPPYRTSV